MNNLTLSFPLNNLSFGNVSVGILREIFKRGISPILFPIGQIDLSAQKPDADFDKCLNTSLQESALRHNRDNIAIKLWHINDSLSSYSRKDARLLTFFELDSLTPTELNILRNQDKVYVTSKYTQSIFKMFGIQSTYVPLGFDNHNFSMLEKRPTLDGVTTFLLAGKLEKRKAHFKVLNLWAKKYGNNKKYRLNCAIHNPFMKEDQLKGMIAHALEGKQYFNINFVPYMRTNAEYNSFLQSGEIYIAMSGGEGRGLPEYHATALGAWPVALNAHAYQDYFTAENSILINPNSKTPAADGIFFAQNGPYNIGNFFDFDNDEFVAGMEKAEQKAANGINSEGLKLQNLTYKDTVDTLLVN